VLVRYDGITPRRRRGSALLLLAILLVSFALRLYQLDSQSFWDD
jgi:hypothetical protein